MWSHRKVPTGQVVFEVVKYLSKVTNTLVAKQTSVWSILLVVLVYLLSWNE